MFVKIWIFSLANGGVLCRLVHFLSVVFVCAEIGLRFSLCAGKEHRRLMLSPFWWSVIPVEL